MWSPREYMNDRIVLKNVIKKNGNFLFLKSKAILLGFGGFKILNALSVRNISLFQFNNIFHLNMQIEFPAHQVAYYQVATHQVAYFGKEKFALTEKGLKRLKFTYV